MQFHSEQCYYERPGKLTMLYALEVPPVGGNTLFANEERPEFIYEHDWRVGDLVMWDNRCALHARTDFDGSERRMLRRVTVKGERPSRNPATLDRALARSRFARPTARPPASWGFALTPAKGSVAWRPRSLGPAEGAESPDGP